MSLLLLFNGSRNRRASPLPGLIIKGLLTFGDKTTEGRLIEAITIPWLRVMDLIRRDPNEIYRIGAENMEEFIAGAYKQAGFDEVTLTPRSGDFGRDVIAVKRGIGSIRIFDQVKAYKPGHVVPAEDVRAMLGVITGAQNVSKGVITTTSEFAPRIEDDPYLKPYLPYRLELKGRDKLLAWLDEVSAQRGPEPSDGQT